VKLTTLSHKKTAVIHYCVSFIHILTGVLSRCA